MPFILPKPTSKSSLARKAKEAAALKRTLDVARAKYEAEYGRITHDASADTDRGNDGARQNHAVDDELRKDLSLGG